MSQAIEKLKNQFASQLDITLCVLQANGEFAEKIMASHFAMLQALIEKAQLPEDNTSEHVWNAMSEKGNIFADYYKACLRDGLDYQKKILATISSK